MKTIAKGIHFYFTIILTCFMLCCEPSTLTGLLFVLFVLANIFIAFKIFDASTLDEIHKYTCVDYIEKLIGSKILDEEDEEEID